ncbi:MAG: hypothetical protein JNL35_15070 [Sphingopyxis sp.]|nr:hypothetical protein [Sphingopyxis sp.]
MKAATALAGAAVLTGCAATPARADPQAAFFAALSARCGQAFAGRIETNEAADAAMQGKAMVMHIRRCTPDRIEIPFHIAGLGPDGGWDRSRTWIVTRTANGLRLKHDHRHADGTKDAVTLYGGDTANAGTATRQEFPVDAESIAMFTRTGRSVSNSNIWAMEATPRGFAYELRRENRHFRVGFSWDAPVEPPPAPWGW